LIRLLFAEFSLLHSTIFWIIFTARCCASSPAQY